MRPEHHFWVTLIYHAREGEARTFRLVFGCEFPSVAAVAEELREFGVVNGQRLRLANDEDGNRFVREREDFMFGAAIVGSIQPYAHEIAISAAGRASDRMPGPLSRPAGATGGEAADASREARI
jgi:hypothetical protein